VDELCQAKVIDLISREPMPLIDHQKDSKDSKLETPVEKQDRN
jgi:hypothetical protein